MDINTNTIRVYNVRIAMDTESIDRMERNTFVAYATSEAERAKQDFKRLMVKEYDARALANKEANKDGTVEP